MDSAASVLWIDRELRSEARPGRAEHERAYLKSELEHYGTSVPTIRRVARAFLLAAGPLDRAALLAVVRVLWHAHVHERRMAAVELLVARVRWLQGDDLALVEDLIRDSGTWALVDPLAIHVTGPVVETEPAATEALVRWSRDEMWLRRAALLAHLMPMRRGEDAAFEHFAPFADALLEDRDTFIRKAIGWVLRERGRKRPDEVGAWLLERRTRASGLTLREASRHLGEAWTTALRAP